MTASMGPPELPGGNFNTGVDAAEKKAGLQWGRRNYPAETIIETLQVPHHPVGFNGAAGITRRKRPRQTEARREHARASMGPPELPGGNFGGDQEWFPLGVASMGPPELPGGNFFVIEWLSIWERMLQWGRRNYPAETPTRSCKDSQSVLRFNGAAGITRRKRRQAAAPAPTPR